MPSWTASSTTQLALTSTARTYAVPVPETLKRMITAPFIATKDLSAERPKVGAIMSEQWAT